MCKIESEKKSKMKKNTRIAVNKACNESVIKIIFFRSYLSEITPANGKATRVGNKFIKLAIESIISLLVTSQIHINITKKTTRDPNKEKS
jgi:hypothetical protein